MIFVNLNAEKLAISYLLVNANLNIIAKEILEPEDFYDNKITLKHSDWYQI
jgi:replicative DNA helicase